MEKSFAIAFATYLPQAASFAPAIEGLAPANAWRFRKFSRLSYANDDKHNNENDIVPVTSAHEFQSSSSLKHVPSPFLALLETEESWKEWHYSFSRNGLTDFLPQFADHISCMVIGSDGDDQDTAKAADTILGAAERRQLPWQVDSEATSSITSLPVHFGAGKPSSESSNFQDTLDAAAAEGRILRKESIGQLVANTATSISEINKQGFDCVLDAGVMNAVISSLPSTVTWHSRSGPAALLELHSLMQEANHAIREHGIYVAITNGSVPNHAKEYLVAMGEVMGMEWTFDLDGLSTEDYCVSVARKYFTGAVNLDSHFSPTDGGDEKHLLKP